MIGQPDLRLDVRILGPGLGEGALPRMIRSAYHLLGLRTFFTTGEKETRAWTFYAGSSAPECAGRIHSDFQRGFIKAEVILSFLGFGVPVGTVSWGSMLNEAQNELMLGKWWQLAAAAASLRLGLRVYGSLLWQHLTGEAPLSPFTRSITSLLDDQSPVVGPDLQEVRGQEHAKRALEVAAAGGHNLLFSGSPGAGKTLLARCLPGILPPLSPDEALEVTQIYSVAGLLPADEPLVRRRPFRSPHHTVSHAGLVGGGPSPRPGELTLSHRGVLFLDELPEFASHTLETLRQPLEDGVVTISRALTSTTFPADRK